jgi:hypothetical protein
MFADSNVQRTSSLHFDANCAGASAATPAAHLFPSVEKLNLIVPSGSVVYTLLSVAICTFESANIAANVCARVRVFFRFNGRKSMKQFQLHWLQLQAVFWTAY